MILKEIIFLNQKKNEFNNTSIGYYYKYIYKIYNILINKI